VGAFGERLKREREKRKITLDEVAQATKISARLLQAIEEEKFDLLPGGIFNKGFIRAYARHLGLNEDDTIAGYTEAYRASHPEESAPIDPEAEGRKILEQRALRVQQERPRLERIPWGKAAVALLLLAFGVAVWGSYSRYTKSASDAPAKKQRSVQSAPEASRTQVPVASSSTPKSNQDEIEPTTEAAVVNPENNAPGSFHVTIHAREDSWVHIQADGKDVLEDTLEAESQKSIRASNQLVIKAGNIGALDFWFNGQKLPPQDDLHPVKILTFDSSGLVSNSPKVQPVSAPIER